MPIIEWHDAIIQLTPYVFRIYTPDGSGTGWLLMRSENKSLTSIVTAAHVVEHAHYWEEPIRIQHISSGNTLLLRPSDRAFNIDHKTDTAAILFNRDNLDLPSPSLPMVKKDHFIKPGVQIGWLGFPAVGGSNLCFFSGHISARLNDDASYLVDGVAINGVSGGPAFRRINDSAELMGIVSAYIPNKATGDVLPGVALIRDVNSLHEISERFRTLDEAQAKESLPEQPPVPKTETDAVTKTSKRNKSK